MVRGSGSCVSKQERIPGWAHRSRSIVRLCWELPVLGGDLAVMGEGQL